MWHETSISKQNKAEWVRYLQDASFTSFLTFTYPTPMTDRVPLSHEQDCIAGTKEYFRRLDFRTFGQKAKSPTNMRLRRVCFFENKSKYGEPVHIHAHALLSVPRDYLERFEKYSPMMFTKVFPSSRKSKAFELDIYDQDKLVSYVSKFSTSGFEFIAELT